MVAGILFAIFVIALLWVFFTNKKACDFLKSSFKDNNVIVFGRKGRGKDLIFQKVINLRHSPYYSNVDYGGKFNKCSALNLDLSPNNYESLIDGKITILDKNNYPYESKDFYFSDGGIIFPSQYDTLLHKKYKSFPIAYALSRHLWQNNIHCNTQSLGRVWKALREQADYYIKCNRTYNLPGFLVVSFTSYEKYEAANNELLPYNISILSSNNSKALKEQYEATNGKISKYFVFISKRSIHYDTRAYHSIIFGTKAPDSRKPTPVRTEDDTSLIQK